MAEDGQNLVMAKYFVAGAWFPMQPEGEPICSGGSMLQRMLDLTDSNSKSKWMFSPCRVLQPLKKAPCRRGLSRKGGGFRRPQSAANAQRGVVWWLDGCGA